jgi:hypothetical protein
VTNFAVSIVEAHGLYDIDSLFDWGLEESGVDVHETQLEAHRGVDCEHNA